MCLRGGSHWNFSHFFIELNDVLAFFFGLSAQVNMAFIFDIDTNLNENKTKMIEEIQSRLDQLNI
jgi:hypothetical protein